MHFITGGAFQGKRNWVKQQYNIKDEQSAWWINGYNENIVCPSAFPPNVSLIVIEGCEELIYKLLQQHKEEVRKKWNEFLSILRLWEQEQIGRKVVLIGCDIGGGIVPIEAEQRLWRDAVGWCYQDLAATANRVDEIWYGISSTLCNSRENTE
ncbi:bifunctional adenosylcobinamide kinase/adenosylcobinamide-phosphate guanylyltransferase [Bacillus sp. 165]|uniref:bifunctional adenosylcobinamide kinase/adenosylcobinamide-phosphate guanylyltransferase n=1 Tax=Bacillus sp. 165 TaxID=1529117 RepID=UPI001ADBD5FA|nr:bifunctional adenosylcobinamide kinase/adenosylcobinamide-phosphate guanylyltransferase [Bacillus sp. 165]